MQKMVTNVVSEKYLREAQMRAFKLFADTIACTFGPMGGFSVYSKQNSDRNTMAVSNYTKDGFTVLKNIEIDKPIESLLKDELIDICVNVIKKVGDGTSSAVILSYLIFKELLELQKEDNGLSKRIITETFKKKVEEVKELIRENKKDCTIEHIYNIAWTSLNGNEEMANVIMNIYKEYGEESFIDVSTSNSTKTVVKGYDGLIYDTGYLDPCFINNEADHTCTLYNPHIYIFDNPVDTPEMINILDLIVKKEITAKIEMLNKAVEKKQPYDKFIPIPTIILCPFISRDANSYLDSMIRSFTQAPINSRYHFCIVSNFNEPENLIDIMKMTGAKFIKKYIDPEQYNTDKAIGLAPTPNNITTFAGTAEKIIVDATSTKIINPKEMRDENNRLSTFYMNYISELEDTLRKYEETREELVKIGTLKRRIHVLKGNMVDLFIGGIGTSDKNSLRDAVEDAVLNCRSAALNGVGYGANYEGLYALTIMKSKSDALKKNENLTIQERADIIMTDLLFNAYLDLVSTIYAPYYGDKIKAKKEIVGSILNHNLKPFNIVTEKYDDGVLSSIETEIAILESIQKVISVVFNTNQFLVPDPRFNIYTWDEDEPDMVINDVNNVKE